MEGPLPRGTGARPVRRSGTRASPWRPWATPCAKTRKAWPGLSTYERFEQVVSLLLTALIGLVIVAAW